MTDLPATPPGWYHAQGDPPDTQRYWDGTHWQGGPQPILGQATGLPFTEAVDHATPGARFVAYLVDGALYLVAYVSVFALTAIVSAFSDVLGALVLGLGLLALLGGIAYNWLYLQGTTGQTIGKRQQGIKVVSLQTRQPIGVAMTFVRLIVIALFAIPCWLDHWWILVDADNQRLSDKQLGNVVVKA
jgi:uncharacterized RDD family membrane protein YckC